MYRVIPHMRNANFVNKYGDLGNPQYLEMVKDRNFVVDAHIEYNMYYRHRMRNYPYSSRGQGHVTYSLNSGHLL